MADSLTIVSVSPSSGIISTATGGASVQFVPEQATSSTVKWQLTSGGSTVHTEDVSSDVTKTGSSWRVQCALATYLTAGTEYTLSLQAYRTGQSGTWVDALTFTAYDNPSVTITTPTSGGTVAGMPIAIAWTASDATGIAYQNVQLWQSDEYDAPIDILYNSDQDPAFDQDTRALALGQGDLLKAIENNARYLVMVDAYNGVGLITGVQHAFTTSWQPPVTPTATVTTDPDTLAASITVTGDRSYTFTDVESFTAPESGVITSLTVDGKSVQDGTPTPSAPVAIDSVVRGDGTIALMADSSTVSTIDLQGNALRSLPDGTHDELTVDSAGVVTLTQRVGYVEYDGSADESWSSNNASGVRFFIGIPAAVKSAQSDTSHGLAMSSSLPLLDSGGTGVAGADGFTITAASQLFASVKTALPSITTASDWTTWLSSNPMTVLYPLATPVEVSLGTITPPFVAEGATVAIDAEVTPTFDATMRAAQSAGTPLTDTLMVVRVSADGTRWVVASDMESGDTCVDPLPPLGVEYAYEITASSAVGATAVATYTETIETSAWALNFGNAAAECVTVRYNPKASMSLEHGGAAYHFADGGAGDGLPVWYSTTERDESGSLSWDTLGQKTADTINALSLRYPVAWIRDPFGHRWRAHLTSKISHGLGRVWQVSIDWDAVRFEEAW